MACPPPPTRPPDASPAGIPERVDSWLSRRSFGGDGYTAAGLLALKRESVSVILPAREVAETIGAVLGVLAPLRERGLIDELVVVDAASADGSAGIARGHGATVLQESELSPEFGPARGKGDAMWRGLAATSGEIVVFLDADTVHFDARFLLGLLGPLFEDLDLRLVKGTFQRPLKLGEYRAPEGGGRVTELVARPLLNLYLPELAGFGQPLAGEIAGRRSLLEAIPFPVGYGIEIAMMIDAFRLVGVDAMAQSDLGTRQNRHQPLRALSAMAYTVLVTALGRIHGRDHLEAFGAGRFGLPHAGEIEWQDIVLDERPPLRELRSTDRGEPVAGEPGRG